MSFVSEMMEKAQSAAGPASATIAGCPSVSTLMSVLSSQPGGLAGLMGRFEAAGLGKQVASWTVSGDDLPISTEQVNSLLGAQSLTAVAAKLGVDPAKASSIVADLLPDLVKQFSGGGMSAMAGKLFGR